jgi:hypothetical protein
MNLSFESKVALATGAAGASATVAMTHIGSTSRRAVLCIDGIIERSNESAASPTFCSRTPSMADTK